jgi:Domain of unknown function (DUF4440)
VAGDHGGGGGRQVERGADQLVGLAHAVDRDAAIDPEVLVAREAAWRAFYDGDVKALGDVLPEDFIGINMNDAPFANRAQILDAARVLRERGGRLVRLTFPETQAQRFGDVVVLYGRFEVVFQSGGAERTRRGRAEMMSGLSSCCSWSRAT